MRRHLLVGRLGPDDHVAIPSTPDEQVTSLQLVAGQQSLDHGIGGALTSLKALGVFPSEIGLDLLIVAAHVHAADTRISRDEQSQDSWTREIRLLVPVSDPARWQAAVATLTRTLGFLTGDRWTIEFRPRPERFSSIVESPETLLPPPFDAVSLFSGGLDSLIGAIDLLESGRTPLLISHAGESATSDAQSTLFGNLKHHFSSVAFDRLRVLDRILARKRPSMYLISDNHGQRLLYGALNKRFVKARGEADWQFRDIRAKAATDSPSLKDAQLLLGHEKETTTAEVYRRGKGHAVAPLKRGV